MVLVTALGAAYLAWRIADDAVTFSEGLVRDALERSLTAELEWGGMELALDPPSVSLSGVRARWPRADGLVVQVSRIALQPAVSLPAEVLDFESARLEGLRVELPGLLPERHPLALSWLVMHRPDGEVVALQGASQRGEGRVPRVSGSGEFAGGGTLRFDVLAAPTQQVESVGVAEIALHFAQVPPAEWAVLVPQLEGGSGTISGELVIELADGALAGASGARGQTTGGISGRFDIDASAAELSIAGAYTKPLGDPATLRGRFVRTPEGSFELEEAKVSVRKARPPLSP